MDNKKLIYVAASPSSLYLFRGKIMQELSSEFDIIALSSEGADRKLIEDQLGVRTVVVDIERRPSILKDVVSLLKLISVFRKERPYIVHSMSAKSGLLSMLAAKIVGVPHRIHSFTGLAFPTAHGLKRLVLVTTEKITCMSANHLLPEGKGVMGALRTHITKKPMTVLGYGNIRGIDLKKYVKSDDVIRKAQTIKEPNTFAFIFVGRIVRDKGINELVEAFVRLYKDYPYVRLYLVGDNDSGIDPISEKSKLLIQTTDAIKNYGKQYDVIPYYAASDCLVFPSYREGFPNVVIEAGALGLPSVVTDIFGSNEIIQEGVNGLIVPPRDEEALYVAMKRMVADNGLRNKLASNAREMIASRYEESFVRSCLIDYYHQIMKEKK